MNDETINPNILKAIELFKIEENSSWITNYDDLKECTIEEKKMFFGELQKPGGKSITIRSRYKSNTKEVGRIPPEILELFPNISLIGTKGNRNEILEIIKQLNPKYLKKMFYNGKFYSKNKKIFPLTEKNILESDFTIFSVFYKIDPTIKDLKINILEVKSCDVLKEKFIPIYVKGLRFDKV